jgi:ABC-type protease/lipase transport system fused ATPase/permease subunit
MIIFFLAFISKIFLFTIEIGVLAFIATIIVIVIAVIIKIIKNKQLEKTKS